MGERIHNVANGVGRLLLRALKVRVVVHGVEHLPASGPVLLACTHISYPDFALVQKAAFEVRPRIRFMCRHEAWDWRLSAWLMDGMEHIPVDRRAPAGAYLKARRLLNNEQIVCAFPEAGISYSYTVRPLMRGAAALAREAGVPVVPVALWGSQRIYSVGRPIDGREPGPDWTRGRRVDVAFGAPVYAAPDADLTVWTQGLGQKLTEMLEGLQRLPHHVPAPGEHAPWYPAHLGGHAPDRTEAAALEIVPRSAVRPTWGPLP